MQANAQLHYQVRLWRQHSHHECSNAYVCKVWRCWGLKGDF
uniref:Uncharacterized protein n=1 Tax=Arundo donax TaxID=35708 RepID=A0A0A9F9J6_ARUDO